MTQLGKSLVFYFRYWTEMQRLESEGGELEGLPEPEKTREIALQVGGKASRQAADLLEKCTGGLEEHFRSIGRCKRITRERIVERNWSLAYSVWPRNRNKPAKAKLIAGIALLRLDDRFRLVPWFWRSGGDEAQQKLDHILQTRVKVRPEQLSMSLGSVGLDNIPLVPDGLDGFDVDREPLIEKATQAFRAITVQDLDALWPK